MTLMKIISVSFIGLWQFDLFAQASITLLVENQRGEAISRARCVLYRTGPNCGGVWSEISPNRQTDARGFVQWTGLPTGDYGFEAYFTGVSELGEEHWGHKCLILSAGNNNFVFRRTEPYAFDFQVQDDGTGDTINPGAKISEGKAVSFSIHVRNDVPSTVITSRDVRARLIIGRGPREISTSDWSSGRSLPGGGSTVFGWTWTPSCGAWYRALEVETSIRGQWVQTDAWNWGQMFRSDSETLTWCRDSDGDGYGIANETRRQCDRPEGYTANCTDCDDSNASRFSGSSEICDGIDNDCDGQVDMPQPDDALIWYFDADGDGFGSEILPIWACGQPAGYVRTPGDCDDNNRRLNPNTDWYKDSDNDGFGTSGDMIRQCEQPPGYVEVGGDCDDSTSRVNPNGPILCEGIEKATRCLGLSEACEFGIASAVLPLLAKTPKGSVAIAIYAAFVGFADAVCELIARPRENTAANVLQSGVALLAEVLEVAGVGAVLTVVDCIKALTSSHYDALCAGLDPQSESTIRCMTGDLRRGFDENDLQILSVLTVNEIALGQGGGVGAPVEFLISDSNGRIMQVHSDGSVEQIPGGGWILQLGGGKLLAVILHPTSEYRINIKGHDNVSYDLGIIHPTSTNGKHRSVVFERVLTVAGGEANVIVSSDILNYKLVIDDNSDGISEQERKPDIVEGPLTVGGQTPGDCNQDNVSDLSDTICLLGFLFLGSPVKLPCDAGGIENMGNLLLFDVNGDQRVDIADGIYQLSFMFLGGSGPVLGTGCVSIAECPATCLP